MVREVRPPHAMVSMESRYENLFPQSGPNAGLVEEFYELYRRDPNLVPPSWVRWFEQTRPAALSSEGKKANGHAAPQIAYAPATASEAQARVVRLISGYRNLGHLFADVSPVSAGVAPLPVPRELIELRGSFGPEFMDQEFYADGLGGDDSPRTLREILQQLDIAYRGTVGAEFMHLVNADARDFLCKEFESRRRLQEIREDRSLLKRAFAKLVAADNFEAQLHKKYVGQKRFSLQGGGTMIPMLDHLLHRGAELGVRDAVMGMAHRGRLNVLVNIAGKPLKYLFKEFDDNADYSVLGAGDVKYHKGFASEYKVGGGRTVKVRLAPNPSHLEFVDPVVVGTARALQDHFHQRDRSTVLPILMHGDSAFAGQGIVYETLNLQSVPGYNVGGTLHIITNNQIGFTTTPEEYRSAIYCTDMAKGLEVPIFHVNAEDLEAVLWVTELAMEYRQRFRRDVIIDLICYRRYGHNEGDDPTFTQPLTYKEINEKPITAEVVGAKLVAEGVMSEEEMRSTFERYDSEFHEEFSKRENKVISPACPIFGRLRLPAPETGVALDTLRRIADCFVTFEPGFTPHPKVKTILEKRRASLEDSSGIDWGLAEALAFGSIVLEGTSVRITGQDCARGTFSHRHLGLTDVERLSRYSVLRPLEHDGVTFEVYNSTLSEGGVIGFEFGYTCGAPHALVLWEAQFGDFANGGQVHIDQFVASSEEKWDQLSGLVMLLPHGFEGQGPEHSSARIERFLQLCSEGNMVVAVPSNGAQYFHLLRRHAAAKVRRPVIVFTPKSLLRLPEASSKVEQFTGGTFEPLIDERIAAVSGEPERIVMCSGKIYYELKSALLKSEVRNVRLVRLEQLHPFPQFEFKKILRESAAQQLLWVQEEPRNMGAWNYLSEYLRERIGIDARYFGREAAASPATGSTKRHAFEQSQILADVVSHLKG